jgi:hypothetical protein
MNSPGPEQTPAVPPEKAPGAVTNPDPSVSPPPLTPEEQMALYEKELKETDWGHQPC